MKLMTRLVIAAWVCSILFLSVEAQQRRGTKQPQQKTNTSEQRTEQSTDKSQSQRKQPKTKVESKQYSGTVTFSDGKTRRFSQIFGEVERTRGQYTTVERMPDEIHFLGAVLKLPSGDVYLQLQGVAQFTIKREIKEEGTGGSAFEIEVTPVRGTNHTFFGGSSSKIIFQWEGIPIVERFEVWKLEGATISFDK